MKKKKTNKETIDQKDFFERKYRIYNDFLISNKDTFLEKNLSYKEYFIKHFECDLIYSLKMLTLAEAFNFPLGAKASFIRMAIEAYIYINYAEKDLLYKENYQLFKFKNRNDNTKIGQKEKQQILKKFHITHGDFDSFTKDRDYIFMYPFGENPYKFIEYYFNNAQDEYLTKDETLKIYNELGRFIHSALSSYKTVFEYNEKSYQNILSNFVKPILINKIGKEYEKRVDKKLVTKKIEEDKIHKLVGKLFTPIQDIMFLRSFTIGYQYVRDEKRMNIKFMTFILQYLHSFLNLYALKEFYGYRCYFKSFLEQVAIFYKVFQLSKNNKIQREEIDEYLYAYELIDLDNNLFSDEETLAIKEKCIKNSYKFNEFKLSYSVYKNAVLNNPKLIVGIKHSTYNETIKEFLNDYLDDKDFFDDISKSYGDSVNASHILGSNISFAEKEDNDEYMNDIVYISMSILRKVASDSKVDLNTLEYIRVDYSDEAKEAIEKVKKCNRALRRLGNNMKYMSEEEIDEQNKKMESSAIEAIKTYNNEIDDILNKLGIEINLLVSRISKGKI